MAAEAAAVSLKRFVRGLGGKEETFVDGSKGFDFDFDSDFDFDEHAFSTT
jgi:hypothetical protein